MAELVMIFLVCVGVFFVGLSAGQNYDVKCELELKNEYAETISNKKYDTELMKKYHRNQIQCTINEEVNKKIIEDLKGTEGK